MRVAFFLSFLLLLLQVANALAQLHRNCKLHYDSTDCACGTFQLLRHVYPWMVHLYLQDRTKECFGVLINNYYVLASATCALPSREETINLFRASFYHMDRGRINANISDITIHPDYGHNSNFTKNELMLFKLNREVDMNVRSPVCLPASDAVLPFTSNLFAFKWEYEGKRRKSLTKLDLMWCFIEINYTVPIDKDPKYICAGELNVDLCGTTGNSLMVMGDDGRFTLYGLISNSHILNVCENSKIGLFTKVSAYVDWIKDNTKDAKYC